MTSSTARHQCLGKAGRDTMTSRNAFAAIRRHGAVWHKSTLILRNIIVQKHLLYIKLIFTSMHFIHIICKINYIKHYVALVSERR
jgi:hypothetical protein